MRRAEIIVILLAGLCALAAPDAQAGLRKCASKQIVQSDYSLLRGAARKTAAAHRLNWKTLFVCMNPGFGHAWVDAEPEPLPDSSVINPSLRCERGRGPWTCEVFTSRTVDLTLASAAGNQDFRVTIPPALPVDDARKLLQRAVDLAPTLRADQVCGVTGATGSDKAAAWLEDLQAAFAHNDERIHVDIRDEDASGSTAVSVGWSVQLEFSKQPADVELKDFRCWGVLIIVT